MKRNTFFILAVFNILLMACNSNDSTPERDNSIVPPAANSSITTPDTNKAPQLNQVPQSLPAASNTPAITTGTQAPNVTVAPQQAKTAPGMNPPHGQPGHRCDISVGAPLNSAPAAAAAPAPVAAPVTTTSNVPVTTTATPAKTAPGMNPPHGQPGHRCDISVGAPLNSPPTNKTAAPTTPPVNVNPVAADPKADRVLPAEAVKKAADSSKN